MILGLSECVSSMNVCVQLSAILLNTGFFVKVLHIPGPQGRAWRTSAKGLTGGRANASGHALYHCCRLLRHQLR